MFTRRKPPNAFRGIADDVELMAAYNADGGERSSDAHEDKPQLAKLRAPPAAAALSIGGASRATRPADMSDQSRVLRGGRHAKGLARFGLPKGAFMLYVDDLYHTLLNMPRYRFLLSFFVVYLTLYLVFSFFYVGFTAECVGGEEDMNFARSFWFSMWTASTIGYSGDLGPNPNCSGLNTIVTFQIMVAALVDTMLMSLVFSRFAAPMPRASTIRFSTHAVLARHPGPGNLWALSFRLANIRKHSLLEPEIQLLLAIPEGRSTGSVSFKFRWLRLHEELTQVTSLKLGLPATVTHVITPDSPMYNMSLSAMEQAGIEILCFMSGIDPMTSNQLQAQHAWRSSEVRMNERFTAIQLATNKHGRLGLDLSGFDATSAAEGMGIRDDSQAVLYPVPSEDAQGRGSEGVVAHMRDLRQRTLRSLSGAHRRGGMMNDPEATPLMSSDGGGGGGGEGFVNGEVEGNGVDLSGGADNVPPLLLHHHPHQHQLDLMSMPGTSGAVAPVLPLSVPPVGGAFAAVAAAAVAATAARGVEGGSGGGGGDVGTGVTQQWDASVAALCESVLRDGGVSPEVQQQAAALRAALIAVPASPAHATVPATAQLL